MWASGACLLLGRAEQQQQRLQRRRPLRLSHTRWRPSLLCRCSAAAAAAADHDHHAAVHAACSLHLNWVASAPLAPRQPRAHSPRACTSARTHAHAGPDPSAPSTSQPPRSQPPRASSSDESYGILEAFFYGRAFARTLTKRCGTHHGPLPGYPGCKGPLATAQIAPCAWVPLQHATMHATLQVRGHARRHRC